MPLLGATLNAFSSFSSHRSLPHSPGVGRRAKGLPSRRTALGLEAWPQRNILGLHPEQLVHARRQLAGPRKEAWLRAGDDALQAAAFLVAAHAAVGRPVPAFADHLELEAQHGLHHLIR